VEVGSGDKLLGFAQLWSVRVSVGKPLNNPLASEVITRLFPVPVATVKSVSASVTYNGFGPPVDVMIVPLRSIAG